MRSSIAINRIESIKHPEKTGMLYRVPVILILAGIALITIQLFAKNNISIPAGGLGNNSFEPSPVRLKISKLKIEAPIVDLGLNPDNTLQVPKKGGDVGWYTQSPSPGSVGPAILVGHLDTVESLGVFYNLKRLLPGDEVEVTREDGTVAVFKIDSLETFSQDKFPSDRVYGPIDHAGIRLITCSGNYSLLKGRYSDNLVAFGSLDRIYKPQK